MENLTAPAVNLEEAQHVGYGNGDGNGDGDGNGN